jgi:tripartite-type tricarboxylate transporter receptor subunit TctC
MAYGSAGTGTFNHLSGELLKSLTGITDLPHVPYRGAGPAIADAIGGQIPMIIPAMTNQVLEFHRTGKLRLLAVTNPTRITTAPEISTAVEAGVPGLVSQQVLALFAPAGTPKPVIAQLDDANHVAMADAAYRQSLVDAAVIPVSDWTTAHAAGESDRGEIGLARSKRRLPFTVTLRLPRTGPRTATASARILRGSLRSHLRMTPTTFPATSAAAGG